MTREDLRYVPHNFAEFMNEDIIKQHENLINSNRYDNAVNLLAQNPKVEGMTASLFNAIEQKILLVQEQLKHKTKAEYILYQQTEPTAQQFEGKVIWAQQY